MKIRNSRCHGMISISNKITENRETTKSFYKYQKIFLRCFLFFMTMIQPMKVNSSHSRCNKMIANFLNCLSQLKLLWTLTYTLDTFNRNHILYIKTNNLLTVR